MRVKKSELVKEILSEEIEVRLRADVHLDRHVWLRHASTDVLCCP